MDTDTNSQVGEKQKLSFEKYYKQKSIINCVKGCCQVQQNEEQRPDHRILVIETITWQEQSWWKAEVKPDWSGLKREWKENNWKQQAIATLKKFCYKRNVETR